jgi:hypothetical protein
LEIQLFGTPEQKADELAERTAPKFRNLRRRNPFL